MSDLKCPKCGVEYPERLDHEAETIAKLGACTNCVKMCIKCEFLPTGKEHVWTEVWNAVQGKANQVDNGDYGEGEQPGDNERWVADLNAAAKILGDEMEKKGVPM
jgi:hypothetical protein